MDKTTLVVLVIIVIVIMFVVYQNSQADADKDRQILAMMQNQNQQTNANIWSSMDSWSGILQGLGGLFGGDDKDDNGESYGDWNPEDTDTDEFDPDDWARINSTDYMRNNPFANSQRRAAETDFNNLQDMVDGVGGMQLN